MTTIFDMLGVLAGFPAFVLGIVVIVVEHRHSPMLQRLALGLLVFGCFLVVVEALGQLKTVGVDLDPSPFGGMFSAFLALNWMCRLRALRLRRLGRLA